MFSTVLHRIIFTAVKQCHQHKHGKITDVINSIHLSTTTLEIFLKEEQTDVNSIQIVLTIEIPLHKYEDIYKQCTTCAKTTHLSTTDFYFKNSQIIPSIYIYLVRMVPPPKQECGQFP